MKSDQDYGPRCNDEDLLSCNLAIKFSDLGLSREGKLLGIIQCQVVEQSYRQVSRYTIDFDLLVGKND